MTTLAARRMANLYTQPIGIAPSAEHEWPVLLMPLSILAGQMQDAQQMRIATENRARSGTVPDALVELTRRLENEARLAMVREYRRVCPPSIRQWQRATEGIGESNMARLIGDLGHPRIAHPMRRLPNPPAGHVCGQWCGASSHLVQGAPYERTVSQLWAYCAVGDPSKGRRRRGVTREEVLAGGSLHRKWLVFLHAKACVIKRGSPFREVYDDARARYEAKGFLPFHADAAALRRTGKEILRELWIVAASDLR